MAPNTSITAICADFVTATESASTSLPQLETLTQTKYGISLLDTKNELFLSYLQALALRNLNVIRSLRDGKTLKETKKLNDAITRKLVEHRVYLEKGVRPLEQKIRFQIDRVVNIANEEERAAERQKKEIAKGKNGVKHGEQAESDDEDSSNSDAESESHDDDDADLHRPNAANFARASEASQSSESRSRTSKDGVYRPPRISATSMPTTTTETREAKPSRTARSATLDEYVRTELSHAPLAEPSIGSTIVSGGRKNKDARQMAKEAERRDYEEMHLMRLPNESKKERAKQTRRERVGAFGGEEWRDLGASADRIGDLTKRKGKGGVLERSRKRRAVEDGPRGDGMAEGGAFEMKKRRVMKKLRR